MPSVALLVLALTVSAGAEPLTAAPTPPAVVSRWAEVELTEAHPAGTMLLVDAPAPPDRVELGSDHFGLASSWYHGEDRVLVTVELPRGAAAGDALRLRHKATADPRAAPLATAPRLRASGPVHALPLASPVGGGFVALRLKARPSLRSVLLRGELAGATLLFEGKRLIPREDSAPGRALALVPAGPEGTLVVLADRSIAVAEGEDDATPAGPGRVSVESASLHAGYPLPAPERFVLGPGASGEYTFEVPRRDGPAVVSFEALDVAAPGQVRADFEGVTVFTSSAPLTPGRWSDAVEFVLPAEHFAAGRSSLLTFYLAAPPPSGRGDGRRTGLRRLQIDVPLPAAGPFGAGPRGDGDHPGSLLLSFTAGGPGAHRLRFHSSDLDAAAELEVSVHGVLLGTAGEEGAVTAREVEIDVPASLVEPGTLQTLRIRDRFDPPGSSSWSVSQLRLEVVPAPEPDVVSPPASPPAPPESGGPTLSEAPEHLPGSESLAQAHEMLAPGDAGMPGQAAKPVGGTTALVEIPAVVPAPGEAPPGGGIAAAMEARFVGPPRLHAGGKSTVPARSGPAVSGGTLGANGIAAGLPGKESLVRGPVPGPVILEGRTSERPPEDLLAGLAGTLLEVGSDPPGAAVFLSRTPGYRGSFVGLTPLVTVEPGAGPAWLQLALPGHHDAQVAITLEGTGRLSLKRSLLAWKGIDFARPQDPRERGARASERGYAAPTPADLDLDGRIDLVVGGEKGDLVWMRDEASSGRPRFGKPVPLVGPTGRRLQVEGYAAPAVVDWDGDGLADLLVGSKSGEVHFFRRVPLSRGLAFEDRGVLVADGVKLSVGNDASPLVVDWNGDSIPDLLVGSGYGIVVLYLGTGGGALTQVGPMREAGGGEIQSLLDLVPVDYADWTGDGIRDLVVGGMFGNLLVYPGLPGGEARRELGPLVPLTMRSGLPLYIGTYVRGFALDLDGDCYRDLVLGNAQGEIVWLRGGEPGDFLEMDPVLTPEETAPRPRGRIAR